MAACASSFGHAHIKEWKSLSEKKHKFNFSGKFSLSTRRNPCYDRQISRSSISVLCSAVNVEQFSTFEGVTESSLNNFENLHDININVMDASETTSGFIQSLTLADLDPATAKLAISILGPFLSIFSFLFILRIVMSWYPKLPVGKFPFVIAYAPTEPILVPTRKLIPPVGGVDVTPVVWFGLVSFLNEILLGRQGLLVLLSQQVNQ